MKKRQQTIGSLALRRGGMRKGFTATSFLVEWSIVANSLNRADFTVDEFADWWCVSRSQAFRRQAIYRECFPEFLDPLDLLAVVGLKFVKRDELPDAVAEVFSTPMVFA